VDIGSILQPFAAEMNTFTKDCAAGIHNNTSRDIVFVDISDTDSL
jgi:hypothetical protein